MQTITKDTATFVRESRVALGLKQAELGKLVGRDRRSIIRYEQGEQLPPAVDLAIQHLLNKHRRKRKA